MKNPFRKPEIKYIKQDGYPDYPYVDDDYTVFNILFRSKQLDELIRKCAAEIHAAKEKMLQDKIRAIIRNELAKQ
jgi:hypothetical protein